MLKQKDVRSVLTLAATLAICVLSPSGGAQAQGIDVDWKGRQLVPPSQVQPKQPQLNQELGNRSKFGSIRDTGSTDGQPGVPQLPPSALSSPQTPDVSQTPFSADSQAGKAGTYGKPLGQTPDSIILPPGIPEDTRIGELRDVSNVKRGALALLLGFNILAMFAWLFVAGKAEVKLDRFFHGDPLGTGKADPATVAANPVTRH